MPKSKSQKSTGKQPNEKAPMHLLPRDALELIAFGFQDGNDKGYIPNDWRGTKYLSMHQDALLRHALAPNDGELFDPGAVKNRKILHWTKAAVNAIMLIHNYINHEKKLNNLYKKKK